MATGITSGQYGRLVIASPSYVPELIEWAFDDDSVVEHAVATTETDGGKTRAAGTKDVTGTARGLFNPSDPIQNHLSKGQHVTAWFYYDTNNYHIVPIQINSLVGPTSIDRDEGAPLEWTISWGQTANPTYCQGP